MKESRGAFSTRNGTEHYHRITGQTTGGPSGSLTITSAILGPRKVPKTLKASASDLHAAYSALLETLPLSPAHSEHLIEKRKLSEETITRAMYATTPTPAEADGIVPAIAARVPLDGVPGFYKRDDRWSMVAVPRGFFIPIRDHHGRIVGAQIRLDETRGTRYLWFSSADRGGVSSGAPLHFALPHLADRLRHILVTEGPLKADIIAERLHAPVVGLPGITPPENAGLVIREAFPKVTTAFLLPDADLKEKPEVAQAAVRLGRMLERVGFAVHVVVWDGTLGKGCDDLLITAGVQVQ